MEIKEILQELRSRMTKGNKKFYHPLEPEDSYKIRKWYINRINIPLVGDDNTIFFNSSATVIAKGYDRVVVGDYGPYIEFDEKHIALNKIKPRWSDKPAYKVKYVWMVSEDFSKTKVYHQKGTVKYADYIPGKYYIDPVELQIKDNPVIYDIWSKI